jgi:hypothetical protein
MEEQIISPQHCLPVGYDSHNNLPLHAADGLPLYPGRHLHIALWFNTSQIAFIPHLHGLWHRPLMQDSVVGHSPSLWQPVTENKTSISVYILCDSFHTSVFSTAKVGKKV